MRATGMPAWIVAITACTASSTAGKLQTAAEMASGTPYSLTVISVMMPERPFGAHEQAGEIVAGRRFARTAAGADDLPVGQDDGQAQHVLLHRAVADGVGARRARGRHAAQGGVGAGIDREEQPGVAQMRVELLAGDPGLDRGVEILGMHRHDLAHLRQVERDATGDRGDMAFERGAGAERHHRHAMLGAELDDTGDLLRRAHEGHRLRRLHRMVRLAAAMLLAQRRRGREPIAQELP